MSGAEPLAESDGPLVQAYDVALVDLDGVVYRGAKAVPHAAESLTAARAAGMRVAFVTNNAYRRPETVAAHLTDLGVPATAADVVTSAQASVSLLKSVAPTATRVLVIGGDGLLSAARAAGLVPVRTLDERPDAVLQGLAPELTYGDIVEACLALHAGLPWVAANLDATIPSARGELPGTGALVAMLREATGCRPFVAGKPGRALHDEAVRRTGATAPLVIGDRLDSDIRGAHATGTPSLLVLTGVSTPADVVRATPGERPTYVAADLRGLLTAHPPADDGLDELRALAGASWAAADAGLDADSVAGSGLPPKDD